MNKPVSWTKQDTPVGLSLDQLLYRIRQRDGSEGLIFDSVTMDDLLNDDGVQLFAFDALVTPFSSLGRKISAMQRVMDVATSGLNVISSQISDPFKRNGVAQVAALFELSDGQTVSVYFHNPDSSPERLAPADEMISWKWLLNKKDITIVVAPERGSDLAIREVARRIMKLAERNSAAFSRANAKRAERLDGINSLKEEIATLEHDLGVLKDKRDIAKMEAENRALQKANELTPEQGLMELAKIRKFLSRSQYRAISQAMKGEEGSFFIDKAKALAALINGMAVTYEQDGKGDDAIAYLHYFQGAGDWFITEKDIDGGTPQAFGLANIGHGGELGYISIDELVKNNVELDLHFTPARLGDVSGSDEKAAIEQVSDTGVDINQGPATESELEQAREGADTNPTEQQKSDGSYQTGEISMFGLDLAIENPKGSMRSGKDNLGEAWSITMLNDYGHIKGTKGADGDEVDIFIGPNLTSERVFVINQMSVDGSFDEHKVMLGFDDIESAKIGYLSNYKPGWSGMGDVQEMSMDEFKLFLDKQAPKPIAAPDLPGDEVATIGFDPTTESGYAQIGDSEEMQLKYQDRLDSFFQSRVIAVRNALRDLGWNGDQHGELSKNDHALIVKPKMVGAGANMVGASYEVKGEKYLFMSDRLTMTPEAMAQRIDSSLPEKTKEELPADSGAALMPISETNQPDQNNSRSSDLAFLSEIIAGTADDILSPELGDEMVAIFERNADDAEVESLLEQAIAAYQKAMEQATAAL